MKNYPVRAIAILASLALLVSACNLNMAGTPTEPPVAPPPVDTPAGLPATEPPFASETPLPPPPATAAYLSMPLDPLTVVASAKDEVFPSSSGDNPAVDRYERPFQLDNSYRPDADIAFTFISDDGQWYYFSTQVVDVNLGTKTLDAPYGVEIDVDKDGRGDFLLWAAPPYQSDWTKTNVKVFTDANNDVGGSRPLLADAPSKGDGYETLVFDQGSGSDPDAAWVRQAPKDPTFLQIAVKQTTVGAKEFLWNAWTDFGTWEAGLFDFNDFITAQEAGSPYASNPNFPLKKLYGLDNTCRIAYGFIPHGNEPGICGGVQPTAAATHKPATAVPQQPTDTPVPPPPPQPGRIVGMVFIDNNGDGVFNGIDTGTNSYELRLFQNVSCSAPAYLGALPASDGNFTLTGLPAGIWCLKLLYTGSPVLPFSAQTVTVHSGGTATINFAIEPPG
jgi:hypothetical protein